MLNGTSAEESHNAGRVKGDLKVPGKAHRSLIRLQALGTSWGQGYRGMLNDKLKHNEVSLKKLSHVVSLKRWTLKSY